MRKKTIQEILVEHFGLSKIEVEKLKKEAEQAGILLQQYVVDKKLVDKHRLLKILSEEWNTKVVDLEMIEIDPDLVKIVPVETCKRHKLVPFSKEEEMLFVAMADTRDLFAIEDIEFRTGLKVVPYLALPSDIREKIEQLYVQESEFYTESYELSEPTQVSHEIITEDAQELTQELLASLDISDEVLIEQQKEEVTDIMQSKRDIYGRDSEMDKGGSSDGL
jgi:type IV pilus assembly protein PilB